LFALIALIMGLKSHMLNPLFIIMLFISYWLLEKSNYTYFW